MQNVSQRETQKMNLEFKEMSEKLKASCREVTAENILELVKDINPWTQKNLQFSSSINKKKLTPTHCTGKLQKIKENLRASQRGRL